jgi:hypothetical protein
MPNLVPSHHAVEPLGSAASRLLGTDDRRLRRDLAVVERQTLTRVAAVSPPCSVAVWCWGCRVRENALLVRET